MKQFCSFACIFAILANTFYIKYTIKKRIEIGPSIAATYATHTQARTQGRRHAGSSARTYAHRHTAIDVKLITYKNFLSSGVKITQIINPLIET